MNTRRIKATGGRLLLLPLQLRWLVMVLAVAIVGTTIAAAATAGTATAAVTAGSAGTAGDAATAAATPSPLNGANGRARRTSTVPASDWTSAQTRTQTSTRTSTTAAARPTGTRRAAHALTPAMAQCFDWASRRYGMSAHLLQAIALQESGLNPRAVNRNTNGSTDIGLMQINSSWTPVLARYGIRTEDLWDPCTNILVGAWILGDNLVRLGPTVNALGAYNARDPAKRAAYAGKVLQRLHQLSPPRAHSASAQADASAPSFHTSP